MKKLIKKPFTFKAIETRYDGCLFRSRLEARWATFFNTLGIPYEYEKETLDLDGIWYLPDFWMSQQGCWIEIKGEAPTPEEREKARRLALYTQKPVATFYGNIGFPDMRNLHSFYDRPAQLWTYPAEEYSPGGPLSRRIETPPHIIALLQRVEENYLDLYVHPVGGLIVRPRSISHSVDGLDGLLEYLQEQHQTLSEIKDFLQEKRDEVQSILTPADGWKIDFFGQEPEGMEDNAYWGECEACGFIRIAASFAVMHHCNDETMGNLSYNSPRLMAAYEAARSARFEWWRR